jgi:peptidoglycan/LPS O-acetylase OafA/YrhL
MNLLKEGDTKRLKGLDFLRGIAVLLVMAEHYQIHWFTTRFGWSGVDLFFVLSGFFVSGILFREYRQYNRISIINFLVRRTFKIWPLFYAALAVHILYYNLKGISLPESKIWAEVLFIQNLREGVMAISWSLGVEEQFYLFLAFSFGLIIVLRKFHRIPVFCFFIMIACVGLRLLNFEINKEFSLITHHFPTWFRMDALMAGVLIAWAYYFGREKFTSFIIKNNIWLLIAALILLLPACLFTISGYGMNIFGLTCTYAGYAIIISVCLVLPAVKEKWFAFFHKTIFTSIIAWIGFYSYAIYLFHFSFGFGIANLVRKYITTGAPKILYFSVYLIANLMIGYISSRLVEQPFLRIRERYFPAKA